MASFEIKQLKGKEVTDELEKVFIRLQNIVTILRDLGLEVIDRFITKEKLQQPTAAMGFPIVEDGMQGIRVSYSAGEGLKVWFTNGFANPQNENRLQVEKRLKNEGLI